MRTVILFIILFNQIAFSQTKNHYDTLLIFGKKYLIEKAHPHFSSISDFPLSVFICEYKHLTKEYKYRAIIDKDCSLSISFDPEGNEWKEKHCIGDEFTNYSLHNFLDSVSVNFENKEYSRIKIKRGSKTFTVNKMQFKFVYDSTSYTNIVNEFDSYTLEYMMRESQNKGKVKYIILDLMFYTDDTNRGYYYLPYQFLLKTNQDTTTNKQKSK